MDVLGLHCCAGFSLVATSGGYSLAAVLRLPTLCLLLWGAGSRALRLQQLQHMWQRGSVAPRRVQSSWTRDQTYISRIGRQILYHRVNRGALEKYILNSGMIILSPCSLLSTLPHQDGLHLMTCPTAQESLLLETSLAVQWLRLHASNPKDPSLLPGWGTKIPHAIWQGQKRKKKSHLLLDFLVLSTKSSQPHLPWSSNRISLPDSLLASRFFLKIIYF